MKLIKKVVYNDFTNKFSMSETIHELTIPYSCYFYLPLLLFGTRGTDEYNNEKLQKQRI